MAAAASYREALFYWPSDALAAASAVRTESDPRALGCRSVSMPLPEAVLVLVEAGAAESGHIGPELLCATCPIRTSLF